jgi:hypothetical protein
VESSCLNILCSYRADDIGWRAIVTIFLLMADPMGWLQHLLLIMRSFGPLL